MQTMTPETMAASEVPCLGIKNKELTNRECMKAVVLLIGRVISGVLMHGLISIDAKRFGGACTTMLCVWGHACLA